MDELADVLWMRLQEVMANFSVRLSNEDSELRCSIVRLRNEAFPLRGYLAFQKHSNDEVAIFVDMQCDEFEASISSDVSLEDGFVIADGPSLSVPLVVSKVEFELEIECWIKNFGKFLEFNEVVIRSAVGGGVRRA